VVGNLRFVQDSAHVGSINAVNIYGTMGTDQVSGQFTLTRPGTLKFTGTLYGPLGYGEYFTFQVTAPSGVTVLTGQIYEGSASLIVSGFLPKGTYGYLVQKSSTVPYPSYSFLCQTAYEFIYYKYDRLNRQVEVGEYEQIVATSFFTQSNAENPDFPSASATNKLITRVFSYDTTANDPAAPNQQNLKGKLSVSKVYRLGALAQTMIYGIVPFLVDFL
jgi:hypothetical protein